MRLEGCVTIITGAGSGIGRELAIAIAKCGAVVVLAGRTEKTLSAVQTAIAEAGGTSSVVRCDVTSAADRRSLGQIVKEQFGRLDILINNAGTALAGPIEAVSDDDLRRLLDVNLHAPIALVRECLPLLRASLNPRVVNVGSVFGDIGHPLFIGYCASKFALRGFSEALRRELSPEGIGVTYVAPRATQTEGASTFAHLIEPFGMTTDSPETAAANIVTAIRRSSRSRYAAGWERLFVWVQRLAPRLIDQTLAGRMAKYVQHRSKFV